MYLPLHKLHRVSHGVQSRWLFPSAEPNPDKPGNETTAPTQPIASVGHRHPLPSGGGRRGTLGCWGMPSLPQGCRPLQVGRLFPSSRSSQSPPARHRLPGSAWSSRGDFPAVPERLRIPSAQCFFAGNVFSHSWSELHRLFTQMLCADTFHPPRRLPAPAGEHLPAWCVTRVRDASASAHSATHQPPGKSLWAQGTDSGSAFRRWAHTAFFLLGSVRAPREPAVPGPYCRHRGTCGASSAGAR